MLIELRQAVFGYGQRPVVRVDHLILCAGGCLGIFGPNGAGKTTLVRGMVGLLPPLQGKVIQADQPVPRIGYMPQHRTLESHWPMSGLDAASLAVSSRRRWGWMGSASHQVRAAMRQLDVDDLAARPFAKLSGGQQQRLLLAGALASEPNLLVLDEPTEGLDVRSRQSLLDLLHQTNQRGLGTVIISHEVEDLLDLADEVAWLHPGESPQQPSYVEVIAPEVMAERVVHARAKS